MSVPTNKRRGSLPSLRLIDRDGDELVVDAMALPESDSGAAVIGQVLVRQADGELALAAFLDAECASLLRDALDVLLGLSPESAWPELGS